MSKDRDGYTTGSLKSGSTIILESYTKSNDGMAAVSAIVQPKAVSSGDSKAPVKETKAPVKETKAPVKETKAPVKETKAPVKEVKAPLFSFHFNSTKIFSLEYHLEIKIC